MYYTTQYAKKYFFFCLLCPQVHGFNRIGQTIADTLTQAAVL